MPRASIPDAFFHHCNPVPMDEAAAAKWFAMQGGGARTFRGRWWVRRPHQLGGAIGYWVPVGLIDPIPATQIGPPSRRALGFRAIVAEPSRASAFTPWNIVTDLPNYGAQRLQPDRARRVRKALTRLEFRLLSEDPQPLLRSGFAVARATAARSGKPIQGGEAEFRRHVLRRYEADPQLVIGAFADDVLVAYALSHGVGATAHFTDVCTFNDARSAGASDGLYWATLRTWASTAGIERANLGMRLDERPGIEPYKNSFGSEVAQLPVIGNLRWPLGPLVRKLRPLSAQRLGLAG